MNALFTTVTSALLCLVASGSARAQWAAAPAGPLDASAPRVPTTASGNKLRVQFVPQGANWSARVYNCERPGDAPFSEDPGCAMLVLQSSCDSRYSLLDGDYVVSKPHLIAVRQPSGRKGLLEIDARGLVGHTDVWTAQLIEDDGRGPRVVMRTIIDACSWGDDGAKCTPVHPSARYVDADSDGDLDLELSFQGGNGMKRRDLFVRQANGRFVLPARYTAPDSFISEMHKIAPPIGVEAASGPTSQCTWAVKAARGDLKLYRSRAGQGGVVGTLADATQVEVAEVRGGWLRLNVPLAGWVASSAVVERCP